MKRTVLWQAIDSLEMPPAWPWGISHAFLRLPVEHGGYWVMVRGEEVPLAKTINLRIQNPQMQRNQDSGDVRRLLGAAKAVEGGGVRLVRMCLAIGVN